LRRIIKGAEPDPLAHFKARNPGQRYSDLGVSERSAIRQACAAEQLYLCAYCCMPISGAQPDTMNEHLLCRDLYPALSLVFDNIVASCTTPGQCDASKGRRAAPLSPLMAECEEELRFLISGRVEGLSARAIETIDTLNLGDHERNNKKLVEKRKELSRALLMTNGLDPASPLEDDELLALLIDDLSQPVDGKLAAYAPAIVNVLKGWLQAT
jgi:uncharacterized protein (TIGR02646 family)